MGIALLAREALAALQRIARIGNAIAGLQQHAELEVRGEVVGLASQKLVELRDGAFRVTPSLQLERERVAGERVVGPPGDETAELVGAVDGELLYPRLSQLDRVEVVAHLHAAIARDRFPRIGAEMGDQDSRHVRERCRERLPREMPRRIAAWSGEVGAFGAE